MAVFEKRGLNFVHINISSLLPKIDKLRYIAKLSEAAVMANYDLIRSDRNRQGDGVACFIKNDLSYNMKSFLPSEIENIFLEIFLPHSKPLLVGTIYRPPSQGSFTETITEYFSKIKTNDTEIYVLGDFNINLFLKQKYIFHQTNT